MCLIAATMTHSGFDADKANWIGKSTQDGRLLPGSIHVSDGDRDHPMIVGKYMNVLALFSRPAMWRQGIVLQIRFEKGRIPGLRRITQRTWVTFQVGWKAPGKFKTKGGKQSFKVQGLDECDQSTLPDSLLIETLAKEPV
jgi:hypothetical protein